MQLNNSIDSQKQVIALLLKEPELYPEFAMLTKDMFVNTPQPFRKIFEAVIGLIKVGKNPSIPLVAKNAGISENYITNFWNLPTGTDYGLYVENIQNAYNAHLQTLFAKAVTNADNPVQAAKEHLEQYEELIQQKVRKNHITDHMAHYLAYVERMRQIPIEERSMRTPFISLNKAIKGLYISNYSILGARPKMGKTALLRALRNHVMVAHNKSVLSFILEMSPHRLIEREIAANMAVEIDTVIDFTFEDNPLQVAEFYEVTNRIMQGAWTIYGSDVNTIEQIQELIIDHATKDPNLAFVDLDYIQKVWTDTKRNTRHHELGYVSDKLAKLAQSNYGGRENPQLHIMAAAQLNRAVEQRDDKRPRMSDLKESGDLEQDADLIMFLYRDGYYYPDSPKPDITEVIVDANRNGSSENVIAELKWVGKTMSYDDASYNKVALTDDLW